MAKIVVFFFFLLFFLRADRFPAFSAPGRCMLHRVTFTKSAALPPCNIFRALQRILYYPGSLYVPPCLPSLYLLCQLCLRIWLWGLAYIEACRADSKLAERVGNDCLPSPRLMAGSQQQLIESHWNVTGGEYVIRVICPETRT